MELLKTWHETWHAVENIHPSRNPYSVHEPVYQASLNSFEYCKSPMQYQHISHKVGYPSRSFVLETQFLKTKFRSLALLTSLQLMINSLMVTAVKMVKKFSNGILAWLFDKD